MKAEKHSNVKSSCGCQKKPPTKKTLTKSLHGHSSVDSVPTTAGPDNLDTRGESCLQRTMMIFFRAIANKLSAKSPSDVEGSSGVVEGEDGVAGKLVPVRVHRELARVTLH